MNAPHLVSNPVSPYDVFVGTWTGGANTFSPTGKFLLFTSSTIEMYWINPTTLRFIQLTDGFSSAYAKSGEVALSAEQIKHAATSVVQTQFDITVNGKAAYAEDGVFTLEGTESVAGVFLFTLRSRGSSVVYSNNQYFTGANTRAIIGPTLNAGQVQAVNAQSFTRISFDRVSLHPG